jgi:hypothetical protein
MGLRVARESVVGFSQIGTNLSALRTKRFVCARDCSIDMNPSSNLHYPAAKRARLANYLRKKNRRGAFR